MAREKQRISIRLNGIRLDERHQKGVLGQPEPREQVSAQQSAVAEQAPTGQAETKEQSTISNPTGGQAIRQMNPFSSMTGGPDFKEERTRGPLADQQVQEIPKERRFSTELSEAEKRLMQLRHVPHPPLKVWSGGKPQEDGPNDTHWGDDEGFWEDEGGKPEWFDHWKGNKLLARHGRMFHRRDWLKLLTASVSAVAIGMCFGFGVLAIFSDDKLSQSYRTVLDGTMQALTAAPAAETEPSETGKTADRSAPSSEKEDAPEMVGDDIRLHTLHYYMAQAGAFQDAASAQSAAELLEKQGYPHMLYEQDGRHHLFVAAAPSRDDLLGIAETLKSKAIDVYVKEITIPGQPFVLNNDDQALRSFGQTHSLQGFIDTGAELAKRLSAWSARILAQGETAAPLTDDEQAELTELHLRFLEENRAIQQGIPEEWKAPFGNMASGLNQAMTALGKTQSANVHSYAWQAQDGVLLFCEEYTAWLKKLGE